MACWFCVVDFKWSKDRPWKDGGVGVAAGETCVYVGGPFLEYSGTTVSYLARVVVGDALVAERGYYYFAVVDSNYGWAHTYLPATTVAAISKS